MNDELHERWRRAIAIGEAWRFVPDKELQQQYTDSGDQFGRRAFAIQLMQSDLIERLCAGEIEALGVHTAPSAIAELKVIPTHFFSNSDAVGWNDSSVRIYGHVYEGVRITGLPNLTQIRQGTFSTFENGKRGAEIEAASTDFAVVETIISGPPQMGRPTVIPILVEIIGMLRNQDKLQCTPGVRIELIRKTAQLLHPDLFPAKSGKPVNNTIRKALHEAGYATGRDQKVQKLWS